MAHAAPAPATIASAVREAAQALAAAGVSDAASEARRLMAAALGLSGAALLGRSEDVLVPEQLVRVAAFLARRCAHEPLSRIVGEREFYGRAFRVTPATLDPRADSETVVDAVLALVGPEHRSRRLRILDVGTGTGCLLLTLLAELPYASGIGTDISRDALAVAQANGERLGLGDRAAWAARDVALDVQGPFDVVVSNPPYIRSADIAGLDAAVRNYDPLLALDGGSDGLAIYRRLAKDLARLVPEGWAVFEVGHDQAEAVAEILEKRRDSYAVLETRFFHDVAGKRRVVAARTRSSGYAQKGLGFSTVTR